MYRHTQPLIENYNIWKEQNNHNYVINHDNLRSSTEIKQIFCNKVEQQES